MEAYHRVEMATLHNRAQPFRELGDDVWARVSGVLSNREAARFAVGCRYFGALARARRPNLGLCADDERLLADVASRAGSAAVHHAVRRFERSVIVCVHCRKSAVDARPAAAGRFKAYALELCDHPVCADCWDNEAEADETSIEATTTGGNAWYNFYLRCGACGSRNEMDEGHDNRREACHSLSEREMRSLDKVALVGKVARVARASALDKADAEEDEGIALRVVEMADRFRRLQAFLFDRHGNAPVAAVVRRELAVGAAWLARATNVPKLTLTGGGRFAWEGRAANR